MSFRNNSAFMVFSVNLHNFSYWLLQQGGETEVTLIADFSTSMSFCNNSAFMVFSVNLHNFSYWLLQRSGETEVTLIADFSTSSGLLSFPYSSIQCFLSSL